MIGTYIHTYIMFILKSKRKPNISSESPGRSVYLKWCQEHREDPSEFLFLLEVHVLRMTRANRCFNDLQEDDLKGNWQAHDLDERVSTYKVHTCHAYIHADL